MKISREWKVGLFAVLMLALLYIGFNYLRGIEFFEDTTKYYTKYYNVGGLTVSNAVSISGYSVGRVSKVSILQADSNKVLVEMTLQGDIIVGEGAKAVLDIGMLGETAIILEPGNISRPLTEGDTINGITGAGITDLIQSTADSVANTIQSTIKRINPILDKLGESGDQINNIIDNVEGATRQSELAMRDLRNDLAAIVVKYNDLMANINNELK